MNPFDSRPEPVRDARMLQSWCHLTFLHWRYPAEAVQRQVPRPLQVESFDGSAWVGATRSRTRIVVAPGDEITAGPLYQFLTARFRLYSFVLGKLACAKVEHPPWPLRSARLVEAGQTLTAAAGLSEPPQPDSVRYSPGVDVRIGTLERV